jgi:predicted PurR-regulated permease PerM
VPVPTVLFTVAVVVTVYLIGQLAYLLRHVLLLMVIAAFLALTLNPLVALLQRLGLRRRGLAVAILAGVGAALFLGAAATFGYPLANGLTHLAHQFPSYVTEAGQGRGVVGRLVQHFHLEHWVSSNAPKLQQLGASLAKPALDLGKGAVGLLAEILAVFTLVVLLLVEGPRIRAGLLALLSPQQAAWALRVATEIRQAIVGYVFGDLLTSVIAGAVIGLTMAARGLPFPLLWALWVALVDFLPQVGGALAGIPTVLFAALQSPTDGIVLAVVFIAYQQLENHVLNPIVLSRTVRTSPVLIFVSVLVGASIGSQVGGTVGAFVAALLAVPTAATLQIVVREVWRLTVVDVGEEQAPPRE